MSEILKRTLLICCYLVVFCCAVCSQKTTGRVHAVIISGGMNKLMNHERYWNDCAFLYRTLREVYQIPQQDITLLISDGGEAGRDMLLADGSGFASSPADLDGDGERDVWLPATLQQVEASLTELAARLTPDDRLLLFLTDHGGTDNGQQAYAWMWGSQRLYDTQLAQLLDAFHVASMSIVLGMCNAGGFINHLQHENRVIATSCTGDEQSWECRDRAYDEFVYHWTCAIAGRDSDGNSINSDANGDGYISMAEAFDYARQHDRREETPQYCSTPATLGDGWTLSPFSNDGMLDSPQTEHSRTAQCYDLQGREIPIHIATKRRNAQIVYAKQSAGRSSIMIIKPSRIWRR